jgi:hypothetical protein
MAPGAGAGKMAAADAAVKSTLKGLQLALGVYDPGDKKYKALLKSIQEISKAFGDTGEQVDRIKMMAQMQASRQAGAGGPQAPTIPPAIANGAANPQPMPQLPQGPMQ